MDCFFHLKIANIFILSEDFVKTKVNMMLFHISAEQEKWQSHPHPAAKNKVHGKNLGGTKRKRTYYQMISKNPLS